MLDVLLAKLDKLNIKSLILKYQLCADFLVYGNCAIEVINVDVGVRRRRRGDITKMVFDPGKKTYATLERS